MQILFLAGPDSIESWGVRDHVSPSPSGGQQRNRRNLHLSWNRDRYPRRLMKQKIVERGNYIWCNWKKCIRYKRHISVFLVFYSDYFVLIFFFFFRKRPHVCNQYYIVQTFLLCCCLFLFVKKGLTFGHINLPHALMDFNQTWVHWGVLKKKKKKKKNNWGTDVQLEMLTTTR